MDKYTVDLDQVLNDFEYSELTTTEQPKSDRTGTNSLYIPNKTTKHSINNVFHSLNEYLNTDITPKTVALVHETPSVSECPPILEITTKLETSNETGYMANFFGLSLNDGETVKTEEILNTVDNKIDDNEIYSKISELKTVSECKNQSSDNNGEIVQLNNCNTPVLKCELTNFDDNIIDNVDLNLEEQSIETSENTSKNNICNNFNLESDNVLENDTQLPSESNAVENCTIQQEQLVKEYNQEETIENCNNTENEEKTSENSFVINENEPDSTLMVEQVELIQEENSSGDHEITVEDKPEVFEIKLDGTDNKNEQIPDEMVMEQNEITNEELENEDKPIGFENLDLDESELNKYLEELEKEYEEQIHNEEKTIDESLVVVEEVKRPDNLPLQQAQEHEEVRKIDLIGDPGSTPYNNVYITKTLPGNNKKNESDTECSTSASPTFSDVSTETTSSFTPSSDTINEQTVEIPPIPTDSPTETVVTETVATENEEISESGDNLLGWLGKQAPLWIPDSDTLKCLHCDLKFTVLKRRHHCRACGLVLCSKCCKLKLRLDYLEGEARVCNKCYEILTKTTVQSDDAGGDATTFNKPNPNNPLEYCSTVPPHQQVAHSTNNPPAVMVPVGVLKRKGSNKRSNKSVMFCDGIRPGSDLTKLDHDFSYNNSDDNVFNKNCPKFIQETKSFIPNDDELPPIVKIIKNDYSYTECLNDVKLTEKLKSEVIGFALQLNLIVNVKIITMDCCVNKTVWCFSTNGLINVGQDEIVILLEILDDNELLPKDIFIHLNSIYLDALKGNSIKELGISLHTTSNFLDSKNHAGFVYIKPTFQCLQKLIKPNELYLIGILIHRWETPWAKLFPLRLILRLGAEYRYYPSPIISTRFRDSVFVETGNTIIKLLADFRNFSYTLPQIKGLTILVEDKNTTLTIPLNRYDEIMKSMNNNCSDNILGFAGNFSSSADSHFVCIQDTQGKDNSYSTHAINIQNKPREVSGASFILFNGALKSSSGLTAKTSIVEDGLMVQIPQEHLAQIRDSLRNMKNHTIYCGCINATSDETVNIVWGEADDNFNVGIVSPIDGQTMQGVPSIRVHNAKDFVSSSGNRLIRWTEVFVMQNGEESGRNHELVDISKVSESIAKATCTALVKYLDLLVSNNFYKIGIRTTLHVDNVSYLAGSNSLKLPPIYMKRLDNELVPVLHRIISNNFGENAIILELIFRILNK